MARITRTNPTKDNLGDSTRRDYVPNIEGPVYDAPDDSSEFSDDSLASKVRKSTAYRNAYALFAQDSDQSWLQRLVAIPTSVEDAKETWTDQIGLTTNYADKQAANYQYCMQQIQQLVTDYYAFKNSLPVTQAQQMADAGINSAITGNGINGSQMSPGNAPTANPSSLQSAQPIDFIRDAASFILDATTGLANIAQQFKKLNLEKRAQIFNEQMALLEFRKFARENGIEIDPNASWEQILTGSWTDPSGDANVSNARLRKLLTHHLNGDLMGGLAQLYPSAVDWYYSENGDRIVHTGIAPVSVGIDATTNALLDLYKNQQEYEMKIKKYDSLITEENYNQEVDETYTSGRRRAVAEYQEKQENIKSKLLNELSESDDPTDKLLLMKILWQSTVNTVELERKQNEWFNANQAVDMVNDIIPL